MREFVEAEQVGLRGGHDLLRGRQGEGRRFHKAQVWPLSTFFMNGKNQLLFVLSIGSRKQNAVSLLTPVSDSVFIALSDGTFLSSLHGSFKNH